MSGDHSTSIPGVSDGHKDSLPGVIDGHSHSGSGLDISHTADVSVGSSVQYSSSALTTAAKLTGAQIINSLYVKGKGDFLDAGEGTNTVISGSGNDVIVATQGENTITTGTGRDLIVSGKDSQNRVMDFNAKVDKIGLMDGLTFKDITIIQGSNPNKGGLDQPPDSVNNTLIVETATGKILDALAFVKADTITSKNFITLGEDALDKFDTVKFRNDLIASEEGEKLVGSRGRDRMTGGTGDDFLYLGDDSLSFGTVSATGPGEFPFPNDSDATATLKMSLKNDVLTISGSYKDFEGQPLFVNGVNELDPTITEVPNGSDPVALIEGFKKVPFDNEGNPLTGAHLHFSASGFADATVLKYLDIIPNESKEGTGVIKATFELDPELQAAFIGGDTYLNIHTDIHGVGEVRGEFNTAKFTTRTA